MKSFVKSKLVLENCLTCCPWYNEINSILSFIHWILLRPKFEEFKRQCIYFIDETFINFSLIVHGKSLNITNDKEENFDDNINFYVMCLLLS